VVTSSPATTIPRGAPDAATRGAASTTVAPWRPWRHRFARVHVLATWLLLIAGATVTSHDAGLAVPDWPTSFGILNPILVYFLGLVRGLATYEHGHRVAAMVVGLLTIVETVWLWRTAERRHVRVLGVLLLVLVLLQGALGGLTVLLKLPPATSIGHGILGQAFFCVSLATAYVLSREWREASATPQVAGLRRAAVLAGGAIYFQLLLGALVRHTVAKQRVPTFADVPVLAHVAFAAVVLGAIGLLAARVSSIPGLPRGVVRPTIAAGILLFVQMALGVLTVLTRTAPIVTILHVIVGATMLGIATLLVLRTFRLATGARP
jgi:cytochrome c oxidase assembly protein subunit 15